MNLTNRPQLLAAGNLLQIFYKQSGKKESSQVRPKPRPSHPTHLALAT